MPSAHHFILAPMLAWAGAGSPAADSDSQFGLYVLACLLWLFFTFIPLVGFLYAAYWVISRPLERQERARFFLDLLETGFGQGRSPEQTILAISQTGERSFGKQFHRLGAHLQSGLSLGDALARAPRLLPPQITAMLKVGESMGDVRKVLPACQRMLKDGNSRLLSTFNYYGVLFIVIAPVLPILLLVVRFVITPKFGEVLATFGKQTPVDDVFLRFATWLAVAQLFLAVALCLGGVFYAVGPRLSIWLQKSSFPIFDWISLRIPWRRKRMQRDFLSLLSLLLEADLPEGKAVRLAASGVSNQIFMRRAEQAAGALEEGKSLIEALQQLDDTGELQWRLTSACRSQVSFPAALSGWLDALDAKAFQEQQAASQLATTFLLLTNAVMVAMIAIGMFQGLTGLIYEGTLW